MIETSGPCAVYTRISDDRNDLRLGVQRQQDDSRKLAKSAGWTVTEVYEDNDTPASKYPGKRPAFERLTRDIRAGKVERLIVSSADRLYRHPRELEDLIDLIEVNNVAIRTCNSGEIDLTNADGRANARVFAAYGKREIEKNRERIRRKMAQKKQDGEWTGGPRPFGWQADGVTLDPKESKLLRAAARRILSGETLYSVAKDWQKAGIRGTRKGSAVIQPTTLKVMLTASRMTGKGQAAAILEPAEYDQLCAVLKGRPGKPGRPALAHLLTGSLLRCGKCGGPMYGDAGRYRCIGRRTKLQTCGTAIETELADTMVMVRLIDYLNSDEFRARLAKLHTDNPGLGKATLEVEKIRARQAELGELYGDGSITKAEWLAAKAKLEPKVKAAEAALEAAHAELAGLSNLAGLFNLDFDPRVKLTPWLDHWHALDIDGRRRAILALVERVTIQPHKGSYRYADPDRVEVTFRE